jgi:hypothetical protein
MSTIPPATEPPAVIHDPSGPRRIGVANALGCAALSIPLIVFALGLLMFWLFWSEGRFDLAVTNHAAALADVAVLRIGVVPVYDPDGPIPAAAHEESLVSVTGVAAGRTQTATARLGGDVGWSAVRVRVGGVTYEGAGATLLEHHGPHQYAVDVYADRVVPTHHTSRGTGTRELRRVAPATGPTTQARRRSHRRAKGGA